MLKKKFIYEVKRPRKDKKLPVVLSLEEISRLFSYVSNIKHKVLLMVVYFAGLRVGEVIRLSPKDVESQRKLIFIKGRKGRKDRYTILSHIALQTLREYWQKDKSQTWLFSSQNKEKHITVRTVQKIFEAACRKAFIKKDVTVHSFRHGFASHLLEVE